MTRDVILNFLTKDMHIQKDPIDYDLLYEHALTEQTRVQKISLTPKNKEKVERKLKYLSTLDDDIYDDYHIIDSYSLALLKNEFGLQTRLKNKILYENKIYRFIFEFYYYKHEIKYEEFISIDDDYKLLAERLDINLNLILEKKSQTLEEMSKQYDCTRESIRLRIKDTKRFVISRMQLPKIDYILEDKWQELDDIDKIILLAYHEEIWEDKFNAYVISPSLLKKLDRFRKEIEKLKKLYTYPLLPVTNELKELATSFVENDNNLYIYGNRIYSLVRNGEHHNANYILNYLKEERITEFFIEDLLHDKFLSTVHGRLMAKSITTSLRNLEAILDREEQLVKIDTHYYKLENSIENIEYLDWDEILLKLQKAPNGLDLDGINEYFQDELQLTSLQNSGFYYLLKKHLSDKFQFRKLVIYNNDYKLQTKFEILAEEFDHTKVILLDESLLTNATNLSRKFYDKGGLIYGNKLYNTKLLKLSKILKNLDLEPDFDDVVYRASFNQAIDDVVLDEIDFKRKFAFKLWAYLHDYTYYNFYATKSESYPELHMLVYALNGSKKTITYKGFIDIIEEISGSRKVYQILQNMIESKIIGSNEKGDEKVITFKEKYEDNPKKVESANTTSNLTISSDLEKMTIIELRKLAKNAHVKNINTYKKHELISILSNTLKIEK